MKLELFVVEILRLDGKSYAKRRFWKEWKKWLDADQHTWIIRTFGSESVAISYVADRATRWNPKLYEHPWRVISLEER